MRKEWINEVVEILRRSNLYAIRQAERGIPVGNVRRQLGIAEQTFYAWKKKYAHLGVSELCRLRQVEEENARVQTAGSQSILRQALVLGRGVDVRGDCRRAPRSRPGRGRGTTFHHDRSWDQISLARTGGLSRTSRWKMHSLNHLTEGCVTSA